LLELASELRKLRQKLWKMQTDPRSTPSFSNGVENLAAVIMTSVHDAEDLASFASELRKRA
jgi:hypothetical protein